MVALLLRLSSVRHASKLPGRVSPYQLSAPGAVVVGGGHVLVPALWYRRPVSRSRLRAGVDRFDADRLAVVVLRRVEVTIVVLY